MAGASVFNFTGVYKGEIKLDHERTSLVIADMNQVARQSRRVEDPSKEHTIDVGGDGPFVVVLLGKIGNGKSATGNMLLDRKEFLSQSGMSSVTTVSSHGESKWRGQKLIVVDTPGLGDPNSTPLDTQLQIEAGIRAASTSVTARFALVFVFALNLRLTEEDVDQLLSLQTMFGNQMMASTVAVWTHGATLESKTLDEYFQGAPPRLLEILGRIRGGSIVVEHQGTSKEQAAISRDAVLEAALTVSGPLPTPKPLGGKKARRLRQQALRAQMEDNSPWWCSVS